MQRHATLARWVLASLLLLAPFWPSAQASAAEPDKAITIATYNVENFLDVFDDPYTTDEKAPVKPRAQIEKIAANVRALNPDVIAFHEMENEGVLRAMANEFLPDLNYQYFAVLPGNSERGINVSLMSRRPILSMTSYRYLDLPLPGEKKVWRFARDLLRVKLQATKEKTIEVFIVHFKSRRPSDDDPHSDKWRLAEATMTKKIIDEALAKEPDSLLALIGDFNDTPETKPLQLLTSKGDKGAPALVDAHALLSPEERITFLQEPFRSTIDYILASPTLGKRLVPGSAKVLNAPEHEGGSDHAPIAATFDLSK
ncbi:MAG: endonuclease/exonuclease/phosphatase family protein [Planctomycetes bacterium]|nr:endonuclease/exonuclease/phosphatase family protein [Planctomycetota bacterium]